MVLMTNEPAESSEAAYVPAAEIRLRGRKTTGAAAIMNPTYIARLKLELPRTVYFEEEERRLLYRTANKSKKTPEKPYTIQEAVSCLGQWEGPKPAPGHGLPGLKPFGPGLLLSIPCLPTRQGVADHPQARH